MNYFYINRKELYEIISQCYKTDIITIDKNNFYYAFKYSGTKLEKMLIDGIKSRHLLSFCDYDNSGYNSNSNGKYYVSISRKLNNDKMDRRYSYNNYDYLPAFILKSNIKAIKTNPVYYSEYQKYKDTIIPKRTSCFLDEYQVFNKINKDNIIGIRYNLKDILLANCMHFKDIDPDMCSYHINELENIIGMISILKSLNIDLPIYDLSVAKELNQEKILQLKIRR